MRPIARGMCKYESILDGTLNLEDFLLMNEYLEIEHENQVRWQQANAPDKQ